MQGELKEKRKALKQSLALSLETDKEKYFKSSYSGAKVREETAAAIAEEVSKNKKRKEKYEEKHGKQ